MTKTNGVFKWWTALNEDDEYYHGPFATKADAIAKGMAEYGGDEDHPRFFVMECDHTVATYSGVSEEALVERIIDELGEGNCECWGEDGWDDAWSGEQLKSLEQALAATISGWLDANPASTWSVGDCRVCEKIDLKTGRVIA